MKKMKYDPICVICGDTIESEIDIRYSRNPETFRYAYMHYYCYIDALEEIKYIESKKLEFDSRYDEYLQLIA